TCQRVHVGNLRVRQGGNVVDRVEYRMAAVEVDDGPVGEYPVHARAEAGPGTRIEEAVTEQEAATQQVVAQLCCHLVAEVPVTCQPHHQEGPVVDVVAVVEVDGLLDRARVDGA